VTLDTPYATRSHALSERLSPVEPPADLAPASFAARLYDALAPLAIVDDENEWALLVYCNALGAMFQPIEDLVRDSPEGPGWSALLDLDRCPDDALAWLAQFVGVRLLAGSTPDADRARIASTDGFRRGTVAAMIGAARATLTGAGVVVLRERDHDPADTPAYAYYLTVITYADETPDPAATARALGAQKPGGLVLDYRTATGQDWQSVKTRYATWGAVMAAYATWGAVLIDEPGT
jgi:Phage tail protein (Tail_P2_I)